MWNQVRRGLGKHTVDKKSRAQKIQAYYAVQAEEREQCTIWHWQYNILLQRERDFY